MKLQTIGVGIHVTDRKWIWRKIYKYDEKQTGDYKKCSSYLAPDKDTLGYACMIHPHVVTIKKINAVLWLICMLSITAEKYHENYWNSFNISGDAH